MHTFGHTLARSIGGAGFDTGIITPVFDYYVDATTGNDNNDGLTLATAWQTMNKLANTTLAAGDRIGLKRGEVWRGGWDVSDGGTAQKPVYYGAYGDGAAPKITGCDLVTTWTVDSGSRYQATFANSIGIFLLLEDDVMATPVASQAAVNGARKFFFNDATNTLYYWASDGADPDTHVMEVGARYEAVNCNDREHIVFEGLHFHGAGGEFGRGFGLKPTFNTPSDITLRRCRISNCYYAGVWIAYATDFLATHDVLLDSCQIDHCAQFGLRLQGQDTSHRQTGIIVSNCAIHNNGLNTTIGQFGIFYEHTDGLLITYCTIHDNQGQFDWSGNLYGQGINTEVSWNIVYNGTKNNIHFDVNSNGAIVKYNVSYGAFWNGIWFEEHLRANGESYVYGNTVYDCLHGFVFGPGSTIHTVAGVNVRNNIFAGCTRAAVDLNETADDNDVDFNIYHNAPGATADFYASEPEQAYTFAQWKTLTGWDANSQFTDPLLVDPDNADFHLQADSPAIDEGEDLGATYEQALNGAQGALWDIGAYVS